MTDQERQILEDAQDQAFASSQQLYDPETSGIRPPPSIIDEETTIEGALFGLEFEKFPGDEAESFGGGFTETFTGACCNYEEDSCNVVTEAECEASGGDFKGNNVECDPDPCGACCTSGVCDDTINQQVCEDQGGMWHHGTTCDEPGLCPPNCACGFDAFDGSGRKFLTRTWVATNTASRTSDNCQSTLDSTTTERFDPVTCDYTCSCSGTGTSGVGGMCSYSCDVCVPTYPFPPDGTPVAFYAYTGCSRDPGSPCSGPCGPQQLSSTVDSATQATATFSGDNPDVTASGTTVVTLSDECNPI